MAARGVGSSAGAEAAAGVMRAAIVDGSTFAAIVEAAGIDVVGLAPGQAVWGMTGTRLGTHAQFATARSDRVAPVPAGVGSNAVQLAKHFGASVTAVTSAATSSRTRGQRLQVLSHDTHPTR